MEKQELFLSCVCLLRSVPLLCLFVYHGKLCPFLHLLKQEPPQRAAVAKEEEQSTNRKVGGSTPAFPGYMSKGPWARHWTHVDASWGSSWDVSIGVWMVRKARSSRRAVCVNGWMACRVKSALSGHLDKKSAIPVQSILATWVFWRIDSQEKSHVSNIVLSQFRIKSWNCNICVNVVVLSCMTLIYDNYAIMQWHMAVEHHML